MQAVQPQSQRLMAALGSYLNTRLSLDNGVCALFDAQDKEVVVIEIPVLGDSAVLHCVFDVSPHASGDLHRVLLELNFRFDTLRGCWLALDERGDLRLCAQSPLESLSEERFCHWVVGFIAQVEETRELLGRQQPGVPPRRIIVG